MSQKPSPTVRVLSYRTTDRAAVQAFVDIEIDALWRLNGVNLLRDGSIRPGQLTPLIAGRRAFIPSIEILNPDLRDSLIAAILAAIQAHLETLPPDQRVKPPRPPEPRQTDRQPQIAPVQAKSVEAATPAAPLKPKPIQTKPPAMKPKLPPPARLLANFPRTTPCPQD
jgi:hypothetical protein